MIKCFIVWLKTHTDISAQCMASNMLYISSRGSLKNRLTPGALQVDLCMVQGLCNFESFPSLNTRWHQRTVVLTMRLWVLGLHQLRQPRVSLLLAPHISRIPVRQKQHCFALGSKVLFIFLLGSSICVSNEQV